MARFSILVHRHMFYGLAGQPYYLTRAGKCFVCSCVRVVLEDDEDEAVSVDRARKESGNYNHHEGFVGPKIEWSRLIDMTKAGPCRCFGDVSMLQQAKFEEMRSACQMMAPPVIASHSCWQIWDQLNSLMIKKAEQKEGRCRCCCC